APGADEERDCAGALVCLADDPDHPARIVRACPRCEPAFSLPPGRSRRRRRIAGAVRSARDRLAVPWRSLGFPRTDRVRDPGCAKRPGHRASAEPRWRRAPRAVGRSAVALPCRKTLAVERFRSSCCPPRRAARCLRTKAASLQLSRFEEYEV